MSQEVFGVTLETWDAIGSIATAAGVLAAAAGSWFAYGQWRQSQEARLDQTRPYVVVTFEQGRTTFGLVDLVIRNVGAGPAYNVAIRPDPPLERARQTQGVVPPIAEVRYFNEPIPLMPPGYELITFFDRMSERCEANPPLPERYTFTVSYDDGHGNEWTEENVVDLGLQHDLLFSEVYTIHHVADALRDIRTQLKQSPLLRGEVEATIETLADREERVEQELEERRHAMRRMRGQREAQQREAANDEGTDTP